MRASFLVAHGFEPIAVLGNFSHNCGINWRPNRSAFASRGATGVTAEHDGDRAAAAREVAINSDRGGWRAGESERYELQ